MSPKSKSKVVKKPKGKKIESIFDLMEEINRRYTEDRGEGSLFNTAKIRELKELLRKRKRKKKS
jgi:hypothetical protein